MEGAAPDEEESELALSTDALQERIAAIERGQLPTRWIAHCNLIELFEQYQCWHGLKQLDALRFPEHVLASVGQGVAEVHPHSEVVATRTLQRVHPLLTTP